MKISSVFIFMMMPLLAVADGMPPVEFVLSTPKKAYEIGEQVPVSLCIRSRNASYMFEYKEVMSLKHDGHFSVVNPKGVKLQRQSDCGKYAPVREWMAVTANGKLLRNSELTKIYADLRDNAKPHALTMAGNYQVVFSAEIEIRDMKEPDKKWSGRLISAPLDIQIVDVAQIPSEEDLKALFAEGGDKALQLRALMKIQYSKVPLPEKELTFLTALYMQSDNATKTQIIRILGTKISGDSFKSIVKILTVEKDPLVRSEAIAVLERYRTSESRALLVNECIARRERSYIAAIVVLGEIGDRSCLDVLRNIASSDDDKWVRGRALESIRRIEQRKE